MELTTLARPYARAAFEFAVAKKSLSNWSAMLNLGAAISMQPKVQQLLSSPDVNGATRAAVFLDMCGDEIDSHGANFIHALASNKRLTLLPYIAGLFEQLKAEEEKKVDVQVTSAFELTAEQQDKLAKSLSSRFGREINVENKVDKSLLGGLIIKAGDLVIDGSIRAKLDQLADAMRS
ncbi:F0F1 ATP synthase subunit delta [Zooshikella marina]|uniref:F0F1 ATP synthase subunit delta n=1 Tax=Zooshikella ganghwensis TaxID=202772 RepID=UPI0003FDDFC1|nr:F0F1 ATP synthase subunit delta [Zooshikella ganghwensis]MBU2705908.1 F0F1 ATP synthase subunit delta [Zooshikella ganghwensis]